MMEKENRRNSFIDVIKGVLAIFVVILHFPFEIAEQQRMLFPFWINMTVPCFMFLSGYLYAHSYQRQKLCSFEQMYRPMFVLEKMIRYVVPYTIAFAAEWIVFRVFRLYLVNIRTYGFFALFKDYLSGGKGQGSYYFPIMIQFIFIFPLIYTLIKKYDEKGLVVCFAMNAVYELLKEVYGMNDGEYRLLVMRYFFVIAAGCYDALSGQKGGRRRGILNGSCIVAGALFIILFSYTDYHPKIITYWKETSFLTCLFMIPLLGALIRHVHWSFKPLELVGKASFHIFLVQMIYYVFAEKMYEIIPKTGYRLTFNILNCVTVGVIFYVLESPLTKWLVKKIKRQERK